MSWNSQEAKCLLCLDHRTRSISLVLPSFPGVGVVNSLQQEGEEVEEESELCLSAHLWSIFLLRKLLQFPEVECQLLLTKTCGGVHPGNWFSLCDECSELARSAFKLHVQIEKATKQLELLREEACKKLKASFVMTPTTTITKGRRGRKRKLGPGSNEVLNVDDLIRDYFKKSFQTSNQQNDSGVRMKMDVEEAFEDVDVWEDSGDFVDDPGFNIETNCDGDDGDPDFHDPGEGLNSDPEEDVDRKPQINKNQWTFKNKKSSTSSPPVKRKRRSAKEKPRSSRKLIISESEDSELEESRTMDADEGAQEEEEEEIQGHKCEICQASFADKKEFFAHMKTHKLICDRCGYVNRNNRYEKFFTHIRSHKIKDNIIPSEETDDEDEDGKAKFSCKLCAFSGSHGAVYKHVSHTHFSSNTFKCKLCSKVFSAKKNLLFHISTIHEEREEFKCECGKRFLTPENMEKHKITNCPGSLEKIKLKIKMEKPEENVIYNCEICQQTLMGKTAFFAHIKEHDMICERCGYQNPNKRYEKFLTHLRGHKIQDNMDPLAPGSNKHSCIQCNFTGTKATVYRHVSNVHFADDAFFCEICSKPFSSKHNMLLHRNEVHSEFEVFRCECGKRFRTEEGLEKHKTITKCNRHVELKVAPADTVYNCEKCGETVEGTKNFKRHMRVHRLTCEICGVMIKKSYKVASHLRGHKINDHIQPCPKDDFNIDIDNLIDPDIPNSRKSRVEQFSCTLCPFQAGRGTVYKHISDIHFSSDTFLCQLCPLKFTCRENLNDHVKVVHEKWGKYGCDQEDCSERFNSVQEFELHEDVHWPTEDGKTMLCEKCGKWFGSEKIYSAHEKYSVTCGSLRKPPVEKIKKVKPPPELKFQCDFCPFKDALKTGVTAHARQEHSAMFKYKCAYCDEGLYMGLRGLKAHTEKLHHGMKEKCPKGCGYVSTDSRSLRRHVNKQLCFIYIEREKKRMEKRKATAQTLFENDHKSESLQPLHFLSSHITPNNFS